jgi:hypothetical protein
MTDPRSFLEAYRADWETVILGAKPLEAMTGFFRRPCFMVSLDGTATLYETETEILAFNASRLSAFREGGVTTCRYRGIDLVSQGPHVTLAIANWELLRADGTIERAWRHYYTLLETGDRTEILVSAFQTGA